MMIDNNSKAETALFSGTVIDVVNLPVVKTKYKVRNQVRIVWVLGKPDGSGYFLDSRGIPFRAMRQVNATMNRKSRLYGIVSRIMAAPPPRPFDPETLVGRSNLLVIVNEESEGKLYAHVKRILPLQSGVVGPPVPQGFVRVKDRPRNS